MNSRTGLAPTADDNAAPKSALIVDDRPDAQQWLTRAVRSCFSAIEISIASCLGEACTWIQSHAPPDLALVDLGLPDGDGVELIAQLSRDSPSTISVVVSIYDDDRHLFPALRAGARGYLLKEQHWERIADLLQGITSGRPPLSPAIARRLLGYFKAEPQPYKKALTPREAEILTLIAKGITQAETGKLLGISAHTVCTHVKEIYRKLNISSRAEAALTAQKLGLID